MLMYSHLALLKDIEENPYPTGSCILTGANLHTITIDKADYTPPLRKDFSKHHQCTIVVPTSTRVFRHAKNIDNIFSLAEKYDTHFILFLCSKQAEKAEIAKIAEPYKKVEWAAIEGSFGMEAEEQLHTSKSPYAYEPTKDISQKRNFALRFASLMGWKHILFLDDDVIITPSQLAKVMDIIERDDVSLVGFNANSFPDLSVAVHAKRWMNTPIDSFIGTGALAVKITPGLSFFPHIYNEDWLFLLAQFLRNKGKIVWAGSIKQNKYDPYERLARVRSEEVGDIIGESLMQLTMTLATNGELKKQRATDNIERIVEIADTYFWQNQLNDRITFIQKTRSAIQLKKWPSNKKRKALRALTTSLNQIIGNGKHNPITAEELAAWTRSWIQDLKTWSEHSFTAQPPLNFHGALEKFDAVSGFIYYSGQKKSKKSDPHTELTGSTTVEDIVPDNTTLQRSRKVRQGIMDTAIIEEYLESEKLSMAHIVRSADTLRYDRPLLDPPFERPDVTVSMYVLCGESTMEIVNSVRSIVQQNNNAAIIQLILWVYRGEYTKIDVNEYRNILVGRLINELKGTTIRLRSGIVKHDSRNVDKIIQHTFRDIVFAYWKADVPINHPILVINSQKELLRSGSLTEFTRQEHTLPQQTFDMQLRSFLARKKRMASVSYNDSEVQTRIQMRLASAGVREKYATIRSIIPTFMLSWLMKEIHVSWTQLDELGHNVRYYGAEKTNSLISTSSIQCLIIDVNSNPSLASITKSSDAYIVAAPVKACFAVVLIGNSHNSWENLERRRAQVMKEITSTHKDHIFISLTYRAPSQETRRKSLRKIKATVLYAHWLQDHRQPVSIKLTIL